MGQLDKVVDIELSQPLQTIEHLDGYHKLRACVRFRRRPLGHVELPIQNGRCTRETIAQQVLPAYKERCLKELAKDHLLSPGDKNWHIQNLLTPPTAPTNAQTPVVTVAYCLCDRTDTDFRAQLQAIAALNYPNLEVLVVEALPADNTIGQTIQQSFPQFAYHTIQEWGLNAARNLAIDKAQGEIIAFLDHEACPEPEWASTIVETLAQFPTIDALAGLILPQLNGLPEQARFSAHHAYERGFEPKLYRLHTSPHWSELGTAQIGSGSNFACRRQLFEKTGLFDPTLDLPGHTEGGGDLDLFARILLQGQTLLYAPWVVAKWQPPMDHGSIVKACRQRIRAFMSAGIAGGYRYPQLRWQFFTLSMWRLALILMRIVRTYEIPRSWSVNELKAALGSWKSYQTGLSKVAAFTPNPQTAQLPVTPKHHMAVRTIDLDAPLPHINDLEAYEHVRIFLSQAGHIHTKIDLHNQGRAICPHEIASALSEQHLWQLLAQPFAGNIDLARSEVNKSLQDFWLPVLTILEAPAPKAEPKRTIAIPDHISIIIPTCDRPDELTRCLTYLKQQNTHRTLEIVVADNRPHSGITPPIVEQFPGVIYVAEPRAGASYARNRAIAATHHDIIVMTDDDVILPPDWLEKLLTPFSRPEISGVTGNVLPGELDSEAQWICEDLKGGLSAGWEAFEVDRDWLDSFTHAPPVWDIGVSANAAFRAEIFANPKVELMNEVLGPGTPCGSGEEVYMFYRILKAGYRIRYDPTAYVWHTHRKTMTSLKKQQCAYMRSAACIQLAIWEQYRDQRAVPQLVRDMPRFLWQYFLTRLTGKTTIPWSIVLSEIWGYFSGFWAYSQSKRRVRKIGRSAPYIPPGLRESSVRSEATLVKPS